MFTGFHFHSYFSLNQRRSRWLYLALCWIAGLLMGSLLAIGAGNAFSSWMRTADLGCVSIVSFVTVLFLPFLFSAFAVMISRPQLLLLICFLKAFSFGFCASGITQCFQSAGWLVRGLLLFSDGCLLPVLLWFWVRHIDGTQRVTTSEMLACAALTFLVGSVDRCLVSPFLAMLIEI